MGLAIPQILEWQKFPNLGIKRFKYQIVSGENPFVGPQYLGKQAADLTLGEEILFDGPEGDIVRVGKDKFLFADNFDRDVISKLYWEVPNAGGTITSSLAESKATLTVSAGGQGASIRTRYSIDVGDFSLTYFTARVKVTRDEFDDATINIGLEHVTGDEDYATLRGHDDGTWELWTKNEANFTSTAAPDTLNDGEWHDVTIRLNPDTSVILKIDKISVASVSDASVPGGPDAVFGNVEITEDTIGAVPSTLEIDWVFWEIIE